MIRDLIVLISENQRIFLKKCSRKDKSFKPFTEFYQTTMEEGFHERTGFTGENAERMGFHGKERDFTVEHGIITERNRISQEIRTGENGILQEKTGFYGSKLDRTGENGISRERTGENGVSRERTGFHGRGTVIHGRERERMGFHGRERVFTGEER